MEQELIRTLRGNISLLEELRKKDINEICYLSVANYDLRRQLKKLEKEVRENAS